MVVEILSYPPEQAGDRQAEQSRLQIPQRHIDSGDGRCRRAFAVAIANCAGHSLCGTRYVEGTPADDGVGQQICHDRPCGGGTDALDGRTAGSHREFSSSLRSRAPLGRGAGRSWRFGDHGADLLAVRSGQLVRSDIPALLAFVSFLPDALGYPMLKGTNIGRPNRAAGAAGIAAISGRSSRP